MGKQVGPNIISGIAASILFLILYLVFKWPLLISLILAIGTFMGIYFLTKPVLKIGDIELTQLANGLELNSLYLTATENVYHLVEASEQIINPEVRERTMNLALIGEDVLTYLEDNPKEISKSRHFLTYYLPTTNKIVDNYVQLKRANVSEHKFQLITERTNESLDLLQQVFVNQRDGYHKDKLVELEVQTELLERTITLGGDEL